VIQDPQTEIGRSNKTERDKRKEKRKTITFDITNNKSQIKQSACHAGGSGGGKVRQGHSRREPARLVAQVIASLRDDTEHTEPRMLAPTAARWITPSTSHAPSSLPARWVTTGHSATCCSVLQWLIAGRSHSAQFAHTSSQLRPSWPSTSISGGTLTLCTCCSRAFPACSSSWSSG